MGCDDWSASDHLAGTIKDKSDFLIPKLLAQKAMGKFETSLMVGYPVQIDNKRENDVYVQRGWDDDGNLAIPHYSEKQMSGVSIELNVGYRILF